MVLMEFTSGLSSSSGLEITQRRLSSSDNSFNNMKKMNDSVATAETGVVTSGDSDSSLSDNNSTTNEDKDNDYGYGDGSPDIAANGPSKYGGLFREVPQSMASHSGAIGEQRRASLQDGAPHRGGDASIWGPKSAAEQESIAVTAAVGRSRRASIQFGGRISPPTGYDPIFEDKALFHGLLPSPAPAPTHHVNDSSDADDILSSLFAKHTLNNGDASTFRRRSSMPFSTYSGTDAQDSVPARDTPFPNGAVGVSRRMSLQEGNHDALGRALANDARNGIALPFDDPRVAVQHEEHHSRPIRRSSMPFMNATSWSAAPAHNKPAVPGDSYGPGMMAMGNMYSDMPPPSNSAMFRHQQQDFGRSAVPQFVYSIKFKRGTKDTILGPRLVSRELPIGTYVKVEADRGEDLGIVVGKMPFQEYHRRHQHQQQPVSLKQVTCLAKQEEVTRLPVMRKEEADVLQMCRRMVWQLGLPMTVVDAEYQFDRNKLTFYYEAERRVDFRDLVRWLYSVCGTRIWMCQIFTSAANPQGLPQYGQSNEEPEEEENVTPIIAPESEWAN